MVEKVAGVTDSVPSIVELADWFLTPPGQYALSWEQAQFDAAVANVFGYYAWQVGLGGLNLLRTNRMPFKGYVGVEPLTLEQRDTWQSRVVLAQTEALPFASQSVDLLILPHAFECAANPHQVLREVERVLVPEGRVVISGFNPWSLWGARNRFPGMELWLPHPASAQVSLLRLRDWFKLLSLEVERSQFGCYAPACRSELWLRRWAFLETVGARWWHMGGAIYVVSAVKRVKGVRLIGPAWKKQRRKRARASSVVVNQDVDAGSFLP